MEDSDNLKRAKEWSQNKFFTDQSRKEIQDLIDNNAEKEIEDRFYKDLEFGTGGMRSILGHGRNRINQYTISKASMAIVMALKENRKDSNDYKIAISYDSRHKSFDFAKVAASVFAANGVKALIYDTLNPVALVSFAIRYHRADAGVMITASHNPPEYNGYKVFASDGKQVTPPLDKTIISYFNQIEDFSSIKTIDFNVGLREGSIEFIGKETEDKYFELINKEFINLKLCQDNGKALKIVYTAIHGAGSRPCNRALNELGFKNIFEVIEQQEPDGNFPTVSSPNPENPEALALAVKLMIEKDADIALGTDPDTDRVGIALLDRKKQSKIEKESHIVYLSGNQIGSLMLYYILEQKREKKTLLDNSYFVKTIVTTPLQEDIANHFSVKTENTLTGFKWICQRMNEIETSNPERHFLFATEESFGYLNHSHVRDKDGVSSIGLISEIALYYKLQNKTLLDALDDIYLKFGYYADNLLCLNYYGIEGAEKINRIMKYFRNNYTEVLLNKYQVKEKKDFQSSKSFNIQKGTIESINLPASNVLSYQLQNGCHLFLRPSGTEPKIKFYIMLKEDSSDDLNQNKEIANNRIKELVSLIKNTVQDL